MWSLATCIWDGWVLLFYEQSLRVRGPGGRAWTLAYLEGLTDPLFYLLLISNRGLGKESNVVITILPAAEWGHPSL